MLHRGASIPVALALAFGLVLLLLAGLARADAPDRDAAIALAEQVIREDRPELAPRAETALRAVYESAKEDLQVRRALGRLFVYRAAHGDDAKVCQLLLARAEAHLAAVTDAAPHDAEAWIDRARGRYLAGKSDLALEALDTFLGSKPPTPGGALAWKGQILYGQARAKHAEDGGGFPLSAEAHRLYARSQGVCQAGVRVDPGSFDAWLHLAWTSQVLGERNAALEAYERAYLIDPESPLPLRGVSALLTHEPDRLAEVLERFKQKDPAHRRIRLLEGYELLNDGHYDEGVGYFEAYLEEYPDDPEALAQLGRAHDGVGNETEALANYERALALDGTNFIAADGIERRLRATAIERAGRSVEEARALVGDYRRLFDLAAHNPYLRNNLAFALREGWNKNQKKDGWREVLLQSARFYEEGAGIIGEWQEEKKETLSWGVRYGYAQMICDAGIVFFTFEAIRDLERAERYFVRSLDYSDYAYFDSWSYLRQVYEKQERWVELHALALKCAAGLSSEAGEPLEEQRTVARKVADDLVADGRAAPLGEGEGG